MSVEQIKIENLATILEDVLKLLRQHSDSNSSSVTFEEFVNYWFEAYAKLAVKPSTQKRYRELLRPALNMIGGKMLFEIKPGDIQKIYVSLAGKVSNCTILKVHRLLHEIFKHAQMWEYINDNPVKKVIPPSPEKKVFDVWDIETAKRFLNSLKTNPYIIPF